MSIHRSLYTSVLDNFDPIAKSISKPLPHRFIRNYVVAGSVVASSSVFFSKMKNFYINFKYIKASVVSDSLQPHELYSPWNSPGQNTGMGSLSLLQGIFPTQGLNQASCTAGWVVYQLSHKRSPRILEWVTYSFSSRSFQPRNRTGVSCITGGFFTN